MCRSPPSTPGTTSSTGAPATTMDPAATPQTMTRCTWRCGSSGEPTQRSKTMKKLMTGILFATAGLFAGAALADDHVIQELNNGPEGAFVFSPSYIQIKSGDTVTFTPTDQGH